MANKNRKVRNRWWSGWAVSIAIVGVTVWQMGWTTSSTERGFELYRQWQTEIEGGNYTAASKIADKLGKNTIPEYNELKELEDKEGKTVNEWLRMAQLATKLGQKDKATLAIKKAWEMDPIRPDVEKLYFESIRQ